MTLSSANHDEQVQEWDSRAVAESWQQGAAQRARLLGPATERMLDLANIGHGQRVLDVAAGSGDQTLLAAQRVGPSGFVLATDIAASMLDVAGQAAQQAGLTNVSTRVLDAQELDLPPASFDAAISRLGLMLIPDLQRALTGIRRALTPGGKLAALVWAVAERNQVFARPMAVARRYAGQPEPAPGEPGPFALGVPGALDQALRAAGFRDIMVEAIPVRHQFPSAAAFIDAYKDAAGPMTALMERLTPADRERLLAEIAAMLQQFEGPGGFDAPGEVLLGGGKA